MCASISGPKVRAARIALGLSQEALARGVGCSVRTVQQIEREIILDPHHSMVLALARELDKLPAELEPAS